MSLPKVIAIVGPTASGKTSLGIEIAKQFSGEVISVDSRQIYRGMDIGTAKPAGEWKESDIEKGGSINQIFGARKTFFIEGIAHWGIDIAEPDQEFSVSDFKEYAEKKIKEILKRGNLPILVGGTGFWLKALIENLDLTEAAPDPKLREELNEKHIDALFHQLKQLDPEGSKVIERNNKRKIIRALEVTISTGKPFSQQQTKGDPKYDVLQIGIKVDRAKLYERINNRVEEMIGQGLVDEVRGLNDKLGCESEAMTGIGYRQICKFLNSEQSLKESIEEIQRDTRHYAKRQITWFKRDESIHWVEKNEDAIDLVEKFV